MASLPRSARLLRALVSALCLVPLVQACGRSDPGDYLYNSDGTTSEGASANTAGRSSTGGTRPNNGGANSTGASSATSAVGGRGPIGSGGSVTGGRGPVPEGGEGGTGIGGTIGVGGVGVAGAGGGVNVTPISCGDDICNADKENCCAGLAGLACVGKNQSCEGAVLGCTLNADCTGNDICCISITGDASAASSCKARCESMGMGSDRQLCQTDDECRMPFRFCTATIFGVNICTRRR